MKFHSGERKAINFQKSTSFGRSKLTGHRGPIEVRVVGIRPPTGPVEVLVSFSSVGLFYSGLACQSQCQFGEAVGTSCGVVGARSLMRSFDMGACLRL